MYESLTKTERNIIKLIGEGFRNDEIADKIGKSKNTVATYIFHLSKQHNAKNRIDLFNKLKEEI